MNITDYSIGVLVFHSALRDEVFGCGQHTSEEGGMDLYLGSWGLTPTVP